MSQPVSITIRNHEPLSYFTLLLAFVLGLQVFTTQAAISSSPEIFTSLDEVESGQLLYKTQDLGQYQRALLQNTNVDLGIKGMVAQVTLTQRFTNTTGNWQEGIYVFPLPDDAAVYAMTMTIGDRVIQGEIKEKQEARKIYQKAVKAGKRAALTEQQRPNLFTTSVGNISPGVTISVTLKYQQSAAYDQGRFSLRFPMTLTPRYIPGQPLSQAFTSNGHTEESVSINAGTGWSQPTTEVKDADQITPSQVSAKPGNKGNRANITVTLDAGMALEKVSSPSHKLDIKQQTHLYTISPVSDHADHRVTMDKDFILSWQPVAGTSPTAALFNESSEHSQHLLLMLMPPQSQAPRIPREMIFIIDTSGSMGGASIRQARLALQSAVQRLKPQDRFNIIEFNSSTSQLYPQPLAASTFQVNHALSAIARLKAGGGTEMSPALTAALTHQGATPKGYLKQVVFITDGAVGNEEALYRQLQQQLNGSRLFTIGIGSAPNSWFMRKAAEAGRGTFTQINDTMTVAEKMSELFYKLESPLSTNIQVRWPQGVKVDMLPGQIPDIYAGEPVLISARIEGDIQGKEVLITGTNGKRSWQNRFMLSSSSQQEQTKGIARLWARKKIEQLEDRKIQGADPALIRSQVLALALNNELVTAYTSFVAVDKTPVRPQTMPANKSNVANNRPAGSTQKLAWPQTDNGTERNVLFGVLALLLLTGLRLFKARQNALAA